ncbi:MAG: hypothetical protein EON54_05225 [Alcaligenaceae bacterium]|jgi:hypothetical protein|nr:MAG: hypothetical protein EON54_05225 [Alcaligenaceae bacterium]
MSLIRVASITDEPVGARAAGTDNSCALGSDGKATGWQIQLAITQWMSPHPSQQSGGRGLAA